MHFAYIIFVALFMGSGFAAPYDTVDSEDSSVNSPPPMRQPIAPGFHPSWNATQPDESELDALEDHQNNENREENPGNSENSENQDVSEHPRPENEERRVPTYPAGQNCNGTDIDPCPPPKDPSDEEKG